MKRRIVGSIPVVLVVAAVATGNWLQQASVAESVTKQAQAYLASLSDGQRAQSQLEYDTPQRVDWHFIPKETRKGLQIKEMQGPQREAAHHLLKSVLSQVGYEKATKIMELEKLLAELEKGRQGGPIRDPERYYFTIFGKPAGDARWGISIEGHHLSLNFVLQGQQVLSNSPMVFAANPAVVKTGAAGIPAGTRVLAQEEQLAFELLHSLQGETKRQAVIAAEAPKEIRAAGEAQPPQEAPAGVAAKALNESQQMLLRRLIEAYAHNLPPALAKERLASISEAGLEKVHFAWAGAEEPGVGHYYRVQGPTFLIEFVNTQPDAAGNPANHIHCIWRDPRGDFAVPVAGR